MRVDIDLFLGSMGLAAGIASNEWVMRRQEKRSVVSPTVNEGQTVVKTPRLPRRRLLYHFTQK